MSRAFPLLSFCFSCSCEERPWTCWGVSGLCHEAGPEAAAIVHSKRTDMSLSIREAQGRNGELVLHSTVGHKHAPCEWCEDIPAVRMVPFAKCSCLTEVSTPEHLAKADEICRQIDLGACEWFGDICSWQSECKELGCELCLALP